MARIYVAVRVNAFVVCRATTNVLGNCWRIYFGL